MKNIYIIFISLNSIFILMVSCNHKNVSIPNIIIDLEKKENSILYSQFVESLDYIELNTNDSCIVSSIENILIDGDTIFVLDRKNAGILIFTAEGKMINQINYYGNSPEEFINIRAFTIDPILNNIYILDTYSQKINKYNYNGEFIESKKTSLYIRDFAVLKNEVFLCILPYYSKYSPYGIWTTDISNNKIKNLKFDIPIEDKFEFIGLYTNLSDQGLYYYDRNWDNFSYVNKDTAIIQYQINLKQRLNEDLRKKEPETIKLQDFAMMSSFSNANNYLLLTYYYYVQDNPYRWVLYNKNTQETTTSTKLINDIDYVQSSSNQVFYLNNETWCRVLDDEVENCNIQLQIMHLK